METHSKTLEKQETKKRTAMEAWYLDIIGCPQCKAAFTYRGKNLHCEHCHINYPVQDEIPALITPELQSTLLHGHDRVKQYYYTEERYDWTHDPKGLELFYHRYRKWETWRQIAKMLRLDDVVLDLGCGTGLITRQFIGQQHMVLALDLNRWALSQMDGKPWVAKIQADGELLPIQDESIDLAVATEMIEHLEAPDKAASEMFRVCKKGRHVVGSVPSTNKVWQWRHHLSMTCGGGEPFHHNYTKDEIADLWQKAGFKIVTIQQSCFGLNWLWILEKPRV